MKLPLKAGQWPKILLAGGLLLILGQGLLQLPEVGARLYPEKFWDREVRRTQGFLQSTQENLQKEEATQEALLLIKANGFPSGPRPTDSGLLQAMKRTEANRQKFMDRITELTVMRQRLERLRDGDEKN